jgi:hypothetical protein
MQQEQSSAPENVERYLSRVAREVECIAEKMEQHLLSRFVQALRSAAQPLREPELHGEPPAGRAGSRPRGERESWREQKNKPSTPLVLSVLKLARNRSVRGDGSTKLADQRVLSRFYRGSYRRGDHLKLVGSVLWDGIHEPFRRRSTGSLVWFVKGLMERMYRH